MTARMSVFRRGFASTFALDVVGRGFGAIGTLLLVRNLPTESFAYVVLMMAAGQFAAGAAAGGIRLRYVRTQAERVSRGVKGESPFFIALAASVALIVCVAAVTLAVATLAGVGASAYERTTFVALTGVYSAAHAAVDLAMYHHQAHLSFARAGRLGVLRSGVTCLVAVAPTVGLFSSGVAIGLGLALGVALVAAWACVPLAWATRRSRAEVEGRFGFGAESNWLMIYSTASGGVAYITIFIVAAFLDDAAIAAYGAAGRYIAIALGPFPALLSVLRVRTSQRDLVDSRRAQVEMLTRWMRRATLPLLAAFAVGALAAPVVIPLIDGGRYPDSIPIFQLLLIAAMAAYLTLPSTTLLMTQQRYRALALFYLWTIVLEALAAAGAAAFVGVIAVAGVVAVVAAAESFVLTYLALRPPRTLTQSPGASKAAS